MTAQDVVDALWDNRSEAELTNIRKRLKPEEESFGVRMRILFDTAKAHVNLPLADVRTLLGHPAYEPRMAAFCILDFKARARKISRDERQALYDCYMDNHDRITTWDMVDRSAPRVVGGYLAGGDPAPLMELAKSPNPLRRRTAMTAPLYFVHSGSDTDVATGFEIATMLVADPDPLVCKPVGIFLKHAGERDRALLHRFLADHASSMPRVALRMAIEKLSAEERGQILR
ncbi:DNA alkylation repair protein [Hoyosella rhizosphaerae]|uniref:DNA alkylation repair protein n=1 Tax=Hoyosella rhizosphaerae TaxID=1755582 RepID=A0A916TZX4_9ACTN|nr:DNA alkylation repair protein [Hoyosella rhizosphaerae]MBN4926984.1 DNA alkylation repair protein [Hoyosella rhizosphaerae]GGC54949.1 hypothetical protein GCM10011410_04180 [Hoyosella rhizosphaerae]